MGGGWGRFGIKEFQNDHEIVLEFTGIDGKISSIL